jgi:hypothetical protein
MSKLSKLGIAVLFLSFALLPAGLLRAEDVIEKAGVGVGVTVGNMWFLPVKAISVTMGALSGALSYVVTGGNAELSKQIWRDTSQGPYIITPDVARMGVGQRPELTEKNESGMQPNSTK